LVNVVSFSYNTGTYKDKYLLGLYGATLM